MQAAACLWSVMCLSHMSFTPLFAGLDQLPSRTPLPGNRQTPIIMIPGKFILYQAAIGRYRCVDPADQRIRAGLLYFQQEGDEEERVTLRGCQSQTGNC